MKGIVELQKHAKHVTGRAATPKNGQALRSRKSGEINKLKVAPDTY